jgi:4'-phosphopantetheinyl transferase
MTSARRALDLPPGEVHLYLVDGRMVGAQQLAAYRALLTPAEGERWARFHFQRHRNQFLVARGLVRGVLSLYRPGVAPADWRFADNGYGRPILSGVIADELQFNLSHTEGRVVLAVAAAPLLGVDIEWCSRSGESWELADTFFSPEEAQTLRALPEPERRRRFFELWTLKEAYIKARGMGLSLPLSDFTMRYAGETALSIAFAPGQDDDPARWRLWCLDLGPDYALSLALAAEGAWRPRLFLGAPLAEFSEAECRVLRRSAGCA